MNTYARQALMALLLCVSSNTLAQNSENNWTLGVGLFEYGGHFGAKYQTQLSGNHFVSGSFGIIGYSLGYEFKVNEKLSLGATLGQQVGYAEDGYFVTKLNYHFSGFDNSGFVIGASLGVKEDDGDCLVLCPREDGNGLESAAGIHLGYKF
ncbi:hypothetical protein [Pseudoalteromonas byunsanensis]|uniref:Outer membrane protein beta-barrel domain-containing protein n=1 Tax=Pseudoalteromonas byunsanensis TaxID=327939 RepID=A0A1S1N415_9GAMM|nr:hypothetical protein [Pseudoalteromonas byunsanensis]OHU94124.1 hypothetical protein BIW53_18105 [Pseudoalteromonas byunsanensis]